MNRLIVLLLLLLCSTSTRAEEANKQTYVIQEHGLMGYVREDGSLLAEPQFRMAYAFTEGFGAVQLAPSETLFAAKEQTGLWGYLGMDGKFLIPPNFTHASPFLGHGYAYVSTLAKKGAWISKTGELSATPQYPPYSGPVSSDGLYPSGDDDELYGYMNGEDEMVIPAKFAAAEPFSEDLAAVQEGALWGYIDKTGTYVIPAQFLNAASFQNGIAVAETKEGYTLIGKDGKPTIGKHFASIRDFSEGLAPAKESPHSPWSYIDKQGEWKIAPQYEEANPFSNDRAIICQNAFCGLLDKSGSIVLPPRYSFLLVPDTKRILAKFANSDYLLDPTGNVLLSPLRMRNTLHFLLYLAPLLLPVFFARSLVRRRIPQLKTLEGEEFRHLSFRTGREISRIRFFQTIAFLVLLLFTRAYVYLGWYLAEALARTSSFFALQLGLRNPVAHPSIFLVWFQALSGLLLLILLLIFGGAIIRGSWIRIEQEVFQSKLTAKRYYRSIFRAQFATFAPLILLVALTMRYESIAQLGYGLTIIYFFLLAVLSPLLLRLSNRTITKADEQLEGLSKELQEKTGIKVRRMQILDEPTGRISNAFAAGLLPRYRRIYVTKNLLEKSSTEELKAVLAHEFGHFKHHDVAKRLGLAILLIWPLQKGLEYTQTLLPIPEENFGASLLLWLLVGVPIITLVVGWRARKAEYAADRYAAELVGDPELVVQALQKIHEHSAIPSRFGKIHKYFLGHPSLLERTQALQMLKKPSAESASN